MRIYSDTLTAPMIFDAAMRARAVHGQDIWIDEFDGRKGRKRARTFTVSCGAESGRYARNSGTHGAGFDRAATWDAWGYFIAEMFAQDPDAVIGQYKSAKDFSDQCISELERIRRHMPQDRVYAQHRTGTFLAIVTRQGIAA